jgi:hypothetical protein
VSDLGVYGGGSYQEHMIQQKEQGRDGDVSLTSPSGFDGKEISLEEIQFL